MLVEVGTRHSSIAFNYAYYPEFGTYGIFKEATDTIYYACAAAGPRQSGKDQRNDAKYGLKLLK